MPIRNDELHERAVLVGVGRGRAARWKVSESLEELRQLTATAGADVIEVISQKRAVINPTTYIGSGKVREIAEITRNGGAQLVIFDDELSPAQAANLEKKLSCPVIDRTGLILDIFAKHARTSEARTQVELAQLKYMLPHLTGQWTHLERQEGAIGTRGPGETQLETDRRAVRRRIAKLERDLKKVSMQMDVRRASRIKLPSAALVGYTNAGKSTLLNSLAGVDTLVEDKLFATLDTTVRRVNLGSGNTILLSDTVGFIKKLPHDLVASFQSTLREAVEADLLIHVVDVSHPQFEIQMEAVMDVLQQIGAAENPMILVFNKADIVGNSGLLDAVRRRYPSSVVISAQNGEGLEELRESVAERIIPPVVRSTLSVPADAKDLLAEIYSSGNVLEQRSTDGVMELTFEAKEAITARIIKKLKERALEL